MASSNRSQVAVESNALMRRATWCGVVSSLAMILTFLNFLPPVSVHYHVRSKVVVSETRLAQLRDLAVVDREAVKHGEQKPIQLMSVKVLDLAEQEQSVDCEPTKEKVVLIEVGTLWSSRCTPERHFTWLKTISKIDPSRIADATAATQVRLARWELEAAQHYKSQFTYLGEKPTLAADATINADAIADAGKPHNTSASPKVEQSDAAAAGSTKTFQLASYSDSPDSTAANGIAARKQAVHNSPAAHSQTAGDFGLQLDEQIILATEQLKQSEAAWQDAIDRSSGALQIAGLPIIASRSTSIPFWMAASILVLGLAAGSTAGWFQHRSYSGGTYQAERVAEQLALDSVPIAGRLVLAKSEHQTSISSSGPTTLARAGHRLTQFAEYALTFWVIIAIARFFLDSVWRDVLVNSPLAALGRMLAGMP
ncbi:MAG: hypothetical protein ABI557_06385 [Aureliella sp.]